MQIVVEQPMYCTAALSATVPLQPVMPSISLSNGIALVYEQVPLRPVAVN